jgi:hypothetical protein
MIYQLLLQLFLLPLIMGMPINNQTTNTGAFSILFSFFLTILLFFTIASFAQCVVSYQNKNKYITKYDYNYS